MEKLNENHFLQGLVADLPRNLRQLNRFMTSDAELIPLADSLVLAITTDSLVEEIESGLYSDPFLIGWMTVMINLSDLAATGAQPIGLVLSQQLPKTLDENFLQDMQAGIAAACKATATFILGGDTNSSQSLQMGATAVGRIEDEKIIMREGAQAGDLLYSTSLLGAGNAFAFSHFLARENHAPFIFQPLARLKEGAIIRQYGSACIDTSDGFFPAIANLMEINGKGFSLQLDPEQLVSPSLRQMAEAAGIPAWFFLAGPHGEFELLFTLPPDAEKAFLAAAKKAGWLPKKLGKVLPSPVLTFLKEGNTRQVDPFAITNLYDSCEGNPELYLQKLLKTQFYATHDKKPAA